MTTHTFDSPTSGDAPRTPTAVRFLHAFRHWRKSRPFPAGLLITLAGVELWLAPLSSIGTIIHEGIGGISAFFIGALMVMFGLTVWIAPAYRVFAGIASILLGLIALPATNLGGFFIGTLLALIGGGLAASWVPRPGWEAPTRGERRRARAAQTPEPAEPYRSSPGVDPAGTEAADLELAALEARMNEPVAAPSETAPPKAVPPHAVPPEGVPSAAVPSETVRSDDMQTIALPEVENTGAAERAEN